MMLENGEHARLKQYGEGERDRQGWRRSASGVGDARAVALSARRTRRVRRGNARDARLRGVDDRRSRGSSAGRGGAGGENVSLANAKDARRTTRRTPGDGREGRQRDWVFSGGQPVLACVTFRSLLHWRVVRAGAHGSVRPASWAEMSGAVELNTDNNAQLAYWLSATRSRSCTCCSAR
jgi:hypothetical protein